MSKETSDRVYLPGLNALRFSAALLVIIAHIELLKSQLGLENSKDIVELFNLGGLGVYFFVVLSGFLIRYLLIYEKEKTGTTNMKAFYIRRLLRIWPLYYLITFLAFFILPYSEFMHFQWLHQFRESNFGINLVLFLCMLPNLYLSINPAVAQAGQLWYIGAENILIYTCSILLSIFVAWLSYEYFMKPFLKYKSKFTIVKSGKI